MADHCGPALESRAACALALVRCVAARVRSRVGRHPIDPCGHPEHEELMRDAKLLRLRAAKQVGERHGSKRKVTGVARGR